MVKSNVLAATDVGLIELMLGGEVSVRLSKNLGRGRSADNKTASRSSRWDQLGRFQSKWQTCGDGEPRRNSEAMGR